MKVQFLFYFLVSDLRNEREKSLDLDGEKRKRVLSTPKWSILLSKSFI
jgi:hypothetical protein